MDTIQIEFFNESGCVNHTVVILDTFFPATQNKINALFKKFIEKTDDVSRENITRKILLHLQDHYAICTNVESLKKYANEYADMDTKQHELSEKINKQQGLIMRLRDAKRLSRPRSEESKEYGRRIKEESEKLKNLKDKFSAARSCRNLAYRSFCSLQRNGDRYKNNIIWVKQAAWWLNNE